MPPISTIAVGPAPGERYEQDGSLVNDEADDEAQVGAAPGDPDVTRPTMTITTVTVRTDAGPLVPTVARRLYRSATENEPYGTPAGPFRAWLDKRADALEHQFVLASRAAGLTYGDAYYEDAGIGPNGVIGLVKKFDHRSRRKIMSPPSRSPMNYSVRRASPLDGPGLNESAGMTLVDLKRIGVAIEAPGGDPFTVSRDYCFAKGSRPGREGRQLELLDDRRNQIAHEGDRDSVQLGSCPMKQSHLDNCVVVLRSLARGFDVVLTLRPSCGTDVAVRSASAPSVECFERGSEHRRTGPRPVLLPNRCRVAARTGCRSTASTEEAPRQSRSITASASWDLQSESSMAGEATIPRCADIALGEPLGYFEIRPHVARCPTRSKETTIARTREQREKSLLDLLNDADAPLSARKLSATLGAAPRTIRDDVARINASSSAPTILSDGRGYRLSRDAFNRQRARPLAGVIMNGGPQARLDQVLRTIIGAEWTNVYELAESLHVSDSTLEGDLSKAKAILKSHDLAFRRHEDRVRITGSDRDRRRLLRSLLFSREDGAPIDVMAAVRKDPRGLFARLHDAVSGALSAHGREMNPYLLSDLLVHLAVSIEHREPGDLSASPSERTRSSATVEDEIAADIMARIHAATGTQLPGNELDILSQAITTGTGHSASGSQAGVLDDDFMQRFDEALDTVAREFGLHWGRSSSRTALARHTRLLVDRARASRQIDAAFGHDFQRTLPMVHEITVHFVHHLEVRTGLKFTEGEVELLSLHLGTEFRFQVESGPRVTVTLVAPRYGRVTSFFADRLGAAVDPSAVIEHRIQDVARLGSITSDLVVSTVPLPELNGTPVIRVSPLLTERDLQSVQRALRLEQDRQRRDRARARLVRLLDPALFLHEESIGSGDAAMRLGAAAMLDAGAVPWTFEADVLERDLRSTTAFPGRFAIPHSMKHDAIRTSICVLTSDRDIDWKGTPVRLMMLFSIAPDGLPAFRDVLELLISVLSDPENVARLAVLGADFEAFLDHLLRLLE